jgi:hypothetical protein
MIQEKWKPVNGYEGLFEISDQGNVRSLGRSSINRWGAIMKRARPLRPHHDQKGYLRIRLWKSKTEPFVTFKVHRLVAGHFIPNPQNLPQVNHLNGIKDDNRAINLAWCDNSENQIHANAMGLRRIPRGEENHLSKIVLHLETGVFYGSAREAYNHSPAITSFEVFCKRIRENKSYTYAA